MEQVFQAGSLAVYLHNPFCLGLCPYCSFYRIGYSKRAQEDYHRMLLQELGLFRARFGANIKAKTVYFGGGTPSLLGALRINELLKQIQLEDGAEITLELNPIQITQSFVQELKATAVNRISLGVQSFNDVFLKLLGRKHRSVDIASKLKILRDCGYSNVSIDLLYGLPKQSLEELQHDLEATIAQNPQHISSYLLTLDEDSLMARDIQEGRLAPLADDELVAQMYELICKTLSAGGFHHYEISNFALSGYEGKHNLSYWHNEPYLALGASASGWLPPWRYTNALSVEEYATQLENGVLMPNRERRSEVTEAEDYLMMGLRLCSGISRADYRRRFGKDLLEGRQDVINKLLRYHMIEIDDQFLKLSKAALFVSNSVIGELL